MGGRTSRNDYLLAGLLRCGACGGHMRIANTSRGGGGRVACATAHQHGTCSHSTYDLDRLQRAVLDGMRRHLTDPATITEAARAFHAEWAAREKKTRGDAAQTRKQLNRIQMQIDRLVVAIRDSDVPVHDLLPQLKPLDAERAGLMERLRLIEPNNNVVHLHPNVIEAYSLNVEKLHAALTLDSMSAENRTAFRNVIDTIVVHPTGKRMAYEFTPYGRLSAIMGVDLFPTARHTLEAETYSKPGRSGKSVSS
jgi:site-specific DNA recombinase